MRFLINAPNKIDTPLTHAVKCGNTEAIDSLVQRGADVEAIDANESTAAEMAVRTNDETALAILVRHGAKLDYVTARGTYLATKTSMAYYKYNYSQSRLG